MPVRYEVPVLMAHTTLPRLLQHCILSGVAESQVMYRHMQGCDWVSEQLLQPPSQGAAGIAPFSTALVQQMVKALQCMLPTW